MPTVAFAAEPANVYKVKYAGGSLLGVKSGEDANLRIAEKEIQILDKKDGVLVTIPMASVTEISYGEGG